MINKITSVLVSTLLAVSLISPVQAMKFEGSSFQNSVYKLAVKEEGPSSESYIGMCSAVAISETELVTANHCASRNIYVQVEENGRIRYIPLEIVDSNSSTDQAVYEISDEYKFTYTDVCSYEVSGDEGIDAPKMFAVGYPMAFKRVMTEGYVQGKMTLDNLIDRRMTEEFYLTNVPITGGNSGGGLFKFEGSGYCLQGLATAGNRAYPFVTFFSTLTGLKDILGKWED